LALDEPKEEDMVVEEGGINFVVDKQVQGMLPQITIDYQTTFSGEGFVVNGGSNC